MKVPGAGDSCDQEEESDAAVQRDAGDLEQDGLAQRADTGEAVAYEVELRDLRL